MLIKTVFFLFLFESCNGSKMFLFEKSVIFRTLQLLRRSVNRAVILTHAANATLDRSGNLRSGITRDYSKKPSIMETTHFDGENQVFLAADCDCLEGPFTSPRS